MCSTSLTSDAAVNEFNKKRKVGLTLTALPNFSETCLKATNISLLDASQFSGVHLKAIITEGIFHFQFL